jgi:hypothetical protein
MPAPRNHLSVSRLSLPRLDRSTCTCLTPARIKTSTRVPLYSYRIYTSSLQGLKLCSVCCTQRSTCSYRCWIQVHMFGGFLLSVARIIYLTPSPSPQSSAFSSVIPHLCIGIDENLGHRQDDQTDGTQFSSMFSGLNRQVTCGLESRWRYNCPCVDTNDLELRSA